MHEIQRMVDRVVLQRPDLTQEFVVEQIMKLGSETVYDQSHWARVCVDRVNAESPLPWEKGYIESEYLSLLLKHN